MTSKVSIRRASLADRQGVLDIDRLLFGGMDYMEAMYTSLLQDPNFRGYVAEVDGRIVSFVGLMVDADEGHYAAVSGRTMDKYKGQGINSKLGKEAYARLHAEFGSNLDGLSVATDKPHVYTSNFWSSPDRLLIDRHVFLAYIVKHDSIVRAEEAGRQHPQVASVDVQALGLEQAYKALSDPYTLNHVLRDPVITAFCNALPLPKTKKNLRKIVSLCNVFASFKASSTKANGISYSTLIRGPVHVNCNINIHVYDHVDILLAHLTAHLRHVSQVVPAGGTVAFRMTFPCAIDKEAVKEFLLPTLGKNRVGKVHPLEYGLVWKSSIPNPKL